MSDAVSLFSFLQDQYNATHKRKIISIRKKRCIFRRESETLDALLLVDHTYSPLLKGSHRPLHELLEITGIDQAHFTFHKKRKSIAQMYLRALAT